MPANIRSQLFHGRIPMLRFLAQSTHDDRIQVALQSLVKFLCVQCTGLSNSRYIGAILCDALCRGLTDCSTRALRIANADQPLELELTCRHGYGVGTKTGQ